MIGHCALSGILFLPATKITIVGRTPAHGWRLQQWSNRIHRHMRCMTAPKQLISSTIHCLTLAHAATTGDNIAMQLWVSQCIVIPAISNGCWLSFSLPLARTRSFLSTLHFKLTALHARHSLHARMRTKLHWINARFYWFVLSGLTRHPLKISRRVSPAEFRRQEAQHVLR